jgi:uncharacterized protein (DUF302 family)
MGNIAMQQLLARFFRLAALLVLSTAAWAAEPTLSAPGVYKLAVQPNISMDDAAESMRLRANALNLKLVAELPLSKQVEAMTGKPQKTIIIFQFCDAVVAKQLIDVNVDFAVFMPCRIALIEDEKGKGWLVMMDVDTNAIAREKSLSPELKKKIEDVRAMLVNIMKAGAAGDL